MSLSDIGINEDDFLQNEYEDFGSDITHVSATETEDFRGNKTVIFSGTSTIHAVFHKREITYQRTDSGIRKLAPAYLMHKTDSGIKRGDKIIANGEEWKVFNVINRDGIFLFSDLYLWSDG